MSKTSGNAASDAFKSWRDLRDQGMDYWAKLALLITSSQAHSKVSSALAKPGLIAMAVTRKATDKAMAQLLAQVNLPSRADVLALSVRLTHIETALDDLAAAVQELRASAAAPPAPAGRAAPRERGPRRPTTPPEE